MKTTKNIKQVMKMSKHEIFIQYFKIVLAIIGLTLFAIYICVENFVPLHCFFDII